MVRPQPLGAGTAEDHPPSNSLGKGTERNKSLSPLCRTDGLDVAGSGFRSAAEVTFRGSLRLIMGRLLLGILPGFGFGRISSS